MFARLLVAVDRLGTDRHALESAARFAGVCGADVRVLHVMEGDCARALRYLETTDEAWRIVDEAVFDLRMAGLGASGQIARAPFGRVAEIIDEAAREWGAEAVVLGPSRRSFLSHLLQRRPVRPRLHRISAVPVITAPRSMSCPDLLGLQLPEAQPAGEESDTVLRSGRRHRRHPAEGREAP